MSPSPSTETLRLIASWLEDEARWGQSELILGRTPPRKESSPVTADTEPVPQTVTAAGDGDHGAMLAAFQASIAGCRKCPLGATRINFVFGTGDPSARLMFIGEGPGYEEDRQGEPFVGPAGQLLNRIIEAIGLRRADVYIANIVKCHPMKDPSTPERRGNDRAPAAEEASACVPYLERQISMIRPAVICVLGATAAQSLLATDRGISVLRGRFHDYKGIPVMPTFHPAALLRNPDLKRDVWYDMKLVRDLLNNK